MIFTKAHCVVGSEGDAGGIIKNTLLGLGVQNIVCIDSKLQNEARIYALKKGSYVYIATPPKSHAKLILLAKELGLCIFVEKPLVYTASELFLLPTLFCNFNFESVFSIGATNLIRYCKNRPGYMIAGDRGVILDLATHLLSLFTDYQLETLLVTKVYSLCENGIDFFAKIFFNSGFQLEVGYGMENFIYVQYPKNIYMLDWLPVDSWVATIKRFWSGECNLEKASLIVKQIDQIYNSI